MSAIQTGIVRFAYTRHFKKERQKAEGEIFDQWLAEYTRQVQAEAIRTVLDGAILSSGHSGVFVWNDRDHYDTGRPRPIEIREWLKIKADNLEAEES